MNQPTKRTLTATLPDGRTITRTTANNYTHVVIWEGFRISEPGKPDYEYYGGGISWASSEKLANATANTKGYAGKTVRGKWVRTTRHVIPVIVPVNA